ncbi:murein hydrolase activator EnvC family protein [Campylobacter sp.]|uniref:murein hydrolase activator EnvC family protein n=1 Tax=Campylobacter sp. TaxID=205 RepID=UPI002A5BBF5B|nr:peptidoglycan DD-metalloendopeptidase family protein [Campylobacter sp.]MDD7703332.1 peptidoglycan DD-metalloendopeptidase family protein [Campylobacteraceae bacterium]MDY2635648.1 peptidoglycan DD-metalloendopeptidase family protein [Campylobacter sp.]
MIFRTFLLILAVCATLFAAGTTANKTQSTKQNLKTKAEQEKRLNKKLDELAKSILSGEENVKTTAEQILALSVQVKELESSAKAADASLNTLIAQNKDLVAEQKRIEASLLAIISKRFAYDLIVPKNYIESEESIISAEILNSLTKDSQNEVNKIAKDYSKTINSIKSQTDKIGAIKLDLAEFRSKQDKLIALQTKQKKDLAQLKSDKDSYEKELSAIQADQEELRKTLEKLAIIAKNEEEEKARAQQKAKLEEAKKAKNNEKLASQSQKTAKNDVRQVGSSYQMSQVKRYTGAKTIAPLEKFTLKQAFGDYTDPIYKIKIFNESVVLRSALSDAVVKNVLDGKVVFAKETSLLQKVVIVENKDGIHTIYAHLSKIAPTIKVGSRLKKGYVIGRVERDLTFEVTQKNYHINPMELIASK